MSSDQKPGKHSIYHFNVGSFKCTAIDDGGLVYGPPLISTPSDFLFTDAQEEEVDEALKDFGIDRASWDEWFSPYTCLLIDTGSHRVLIDTGAGNFTPQTGQLPDALVSEGVALDSIDAIVITHGHIDHLNGCAKDDGTPMYPNARHVISTFEHEFWVSTEAQKALDPAFAELLIPTARKNLTAVKDKLHLINESYEIVPGIAAHPAYGHTPGHLVVEVKSEGEDRRVTAGINTNALYILGDSILHPIHCKCPHFSAAVDVRKEQAIKTRRDLLEKLSREKCLVQFYHFPFPGVGYIKEEADKKSHKFHPYDPNTMISQ